MHHVTTIDQLVSLFGTPGEASLRKEVPTLAPVYQAWIARSPFAVLATVGPEGLDTSPRGDPAPLVRVRDEHTLLLPERRGNQRIDSLRNIVHDPRVSLIFFVPGVRETVRVNGRARIVTEPALLAGFVVQGRAPVCVIEVTVQAVFFQCARALLRSSLWSDAQVAARPAVPSAGQMLAALTSGAVGGQAYDDALPSRQADTLY